MQLMRKLRDLFPWKRPKDTQQVITPLPPSSSEVRPKYGQPIPVRVRDQRDYDSR